MSALTDLFGATLITHSGERAQTSSALSGCEYVLYYASAHWCPPCKAFTPTLSTFYAKHGNEMKFKVVFGSNDETEEKMKSYFDSMKIDLALPFKAPEIAKISKKYSIKGIPTLLVFDAAGNLISSKGREGVSADPTARGFPWREKSVWELLDGASGYVNAAGAPVELASLKRPNAVGLYFSASWCGPCRHFTPQLKAWYATTASSTSGSSAPPPCEIVFISSDRDESSFKNYHAEMPWPALVFSDRATKNALSELFEIEGIPTLVFIDQQGNIITKNGREKVSADPTGFPWPRKPVDKLEDAAGEYINEIPTCILFTDMMTDAAAEAEAVEHFTKVAKDNFGSGDRIRFAHAADGDDAIPQVRKFLGGEHLKDKNGPRSARVTLVDVQNGEKTMLNDGALDVPSVADLEALVRAQLA